MENQKYLVIITLVDGQNFTVPSPDKVEAKVFAEARFGNESVLRSDPIRLTNSNPEFVTELAWQLDRKSLHQLRVERKAIKLQVFMQTRERKKTRPPNDDGTHSTNESEPNETHKVELIGYTILDLRSAQQSGTSNQEPKFRWCPLLNPKFRKSSYNRPEIQLAITLNRLDDETNRDNSNQFSSISSLPDGEQTNESIEFLSTHQVSSNISEHNTINDSNRLYTTCLDASLNSDLVDRDEIIDNDIIIRSRDGLIYIYDAKHQKSSLEDCKERYRLHIAIPFSSSLDLLVGGEERLREKYHFSINLFGSTFKTREFFGSSNEPKEININIMTTHPAALATYFELNSNLDIRFHRNDNGEILGLSTLQLNQICSLDLKCRSIEGIFALQSINDGEQFPSNASSPSIGISVVLEKVDTFVSERQSTSFDNESVPSIKKHSSDNHGDYLSNSMLNYTHQVTMNDSNDEVIEAANANELNNEVLLEDPDPSEDDHHYCFTIDLKKFSYSPSQRLIPMLRELVIRYCYSFFGYLDKITTDASIPINATSSIIVSGFCEFNFATTSTSLLAALTEIPLELEILAVDETRLKEIENETHERVVATCSINLAQVLGLEEENITQKGYLVISKTTPVPIFALDGQEIGDLQIYLCLQDLGKPTKKFKASIENLCENLSGSRRDSLVNINDSLTRSMENCRLDSFIAEMKKNFEAWKEENFNKFVDEIRRRDNDRFKRLYQRIEAKEARRDQELKRKLDDLNNLEKKFLNSLANVESLEGMLIESVQNLKNKNASLDDRLSALEMKISELATCNGRASDEELTMDRLREVEVLQQPSKEPEIKREHFKTVPSWVRNVQISPRRSSLNHPTISASGSSQQPVRSASLVRKETSGMGKQVTRRAVGSMPTVSNGITSRVRSNSTKLTLSKSTMEKLSALRKEKAELLKRGCKPNDEMILAINAIIEKLAC